MKFNVHDHRSQCAGFLVLGLGVGGLSGYLLGIHLVRARADADIADVREHFRAKAEDLQRGSALGAFTVLPTTATAVVREQPVDARDGARRNRAADEARPADAYRDPDPDDPEFGLSEDDYEDGAAQSLGVDGDGNGVEDLLESEDDGALDDGGDEDGSSSSGRNPVRLDPYIITEAKFAEENLDYQKLVVRYFYGDKILVDDADAPIRDFKWTVGEDTLRLFDVNPDPNNPYIIYVRNDKIQVDFEVCLDYGTYVETILGYGTPNPKPRHIQRGRG